MPQALLQAGDLTEPLHPLGLSQALAGVGLDLQQPGLLRQVQPEHGAPDTGVFKLARGPIGSVAGAERDLAQAEVVTEVLPLSVAGLTVLLAGTVRSALVDELPVVADHLLGIDSDVSLSGVEIEMAKELRGNVDRQAAIHCLRREDSAEVVRCEPQRSPVDVDDAGPQRRLGEELADPVGGDDLQPVLGGALKQVRQRWAENPLVAAVPGQQRHSLAGALDAANDPGERRDQIRGSAGMTRSRSVLDGLT